VQIPSRGIRARNSSGSFNLAGVGSSVLVTTVTEPDRLGDLVKREAANSSTMKGP
jgi:hypothetical protein